MSNRETLAKARQLLVRSILSGERPDPEEMALMSDPYKKVWEDHDGPSGATEQGWGDLLDVLDAPRGGKLH